jgi:TRAP-type mannitol/chloroaromatic compound transport system substrate-binding protein
MVSGLNRRAVMAAAAALGAGASLTARPAKAQVEHRLRMQSHLAETSIVGGAFGRFARLCSLLSGGRLEVEMHYSSAIVREFEAFDAARRGIIDGDCVSSTFITGKDPAFQFFGDVLGGYSEPADFRSWYHYGGGREIGRELYAEHGMYLAGHVFAGVESLVSSRPLAGIDDLKDWKFRCPPGMQTEIFVALGAAPVVMPFAEVFTAITSGVVDGADVSNLSLNTQLGVYDFAKHTTFPGFHSMPGEHCAINLDKWNSLPEDLQEILEAALFVAGNDAYLRTIAGNAKVAPELQAKGVTFYQWSEADIARFRAVSRDVWLDWGTRSPMARKAVDSHVGFMTSLGMLS